MGVLCRFQLGDDCIVAATMRVMRCSCFPVPQHHGQYATVPDKIQAEVEPDEQIAAYNLSHR